LQLKKYDSNQVSWKHLTKWYTQVEYDGHIVSKPQGSIFPDVSHHQNGQDSRVELKPNLTKSVTKPVSFENARLLLGIVLKHAVPDLQAAHEILEVGKSDATEARAVKGHNDLAAHLEAGTTFNVIYKIN
jgi:hypothetical protein